MKRRLFLVSLLAMSILATIVLPSVMRNTYAPFSDSEVINASAQAGVWTGSITITKDAQPNHAQDFMFTENVPALCVIGSLDDDSDGTLPNTVTCTNVATGSYTVTEDAVIGWAVSNIACSGDASILIGADGDFDPGDTGVTIDLDASENVVCTFTNIPTTGSITITKDTQPNNAQDFAFTDDIAAPCTVGPLDDDVDGALSNTVNCTNVATGTYTVTENAVTGWVVSNISCTGDANVLIGADTDFDPGDTGVTIDLDALEDVSCTFTNIPTTGSITITKDTQPNSAQDFTFSDNIPAPCAIGPLDDDTDAALSNTVTCTEVTAGSYMVQETVVAGWILTNISCTGDANILIGADGDFDPGDTGVTIDLDAGETVSCTFTNVKNEGTIVIVKDTQPNSAKDFSFSTTGGLTPASFFLDDDADGALSNTRTYTVLPSGTYTVTEASTVGWALSDLSCSDPDGGSSDSGSTATIDLDPGETVTCTFVNVEVPVPECGFTTPNPARVFVTQGVTFNAGNQDQIIVGTSGDDIINGGNAKDCILGGEGNDTINGANGPDGLFGEGGNDALNGGNGPDYCDGGPGTDTQVNCETIVGVP